MKNFNFGENLRMLRLYKNLCQEGMAAGLNISQSSYSRIEMVRQTPDVRLINQLAAVLGVRPKDLISTRWYSEAVNGGPEGTLRSVAVLSRKGQFTYGILLAVAAWDFTAGFAEEGKYESVDALLLTGSIVGLVAFFIYYFTVKRRKMMDEEE